MKWDLMISVSDVWTRLSTPVILCFSILRPAVQSKTNIAAKLDCARIRMYPRKRNDVYCMSPAQYVCSSTRALPADKIRPRLPGVGILFSFYPLSYFDADL